MRERELKAEVALTIGRLYQRGLTTATGGNVSARYGSLMLITPSGKDKAALTADDIARVDIKTGENLTPEFKLSIESSMHRALYLSRPDCMAICHSHPTTSSLFTATKEEIRTDLIAESWYLLGKVIKVPYALMGSKELAENVSRLASEGDVFLLENHGVLTLGKTLLNAFDKIECLEQAAKMTVIAKGFTLSPLNTERKAEIDLMKG